VRFSCSAEDDAYVLAFTSGVQEEGGGATVRSKDGTKVLVYDAKDMGKGPVCEIPVPNDMPYGLHSHWVPWEMLEE
jgi:carotenoid cleavage dioxygenase-like enzyme